MSQTRSADHKPSRRTVRAIVWMAAVVLIAAAAAADDRVIVRSAGDVHVDPERLQLMHVAAVTGGDDALRRAAGAASLGEAPAPGAVRVIDRAEVLTALQAAGVAPPAVYLDMPGPIRVHRNAVTISDAFLERLVTGYLLERVPWPRERVRVERMIVSGETVLPPGRVTYQVMPPARPDYLRTIALTVAFFVDDVPRARTRVSVNLTVTTPVVVTRHPIGRNQTIAAEDIQMVDMNLASLPTGVITDPDEVVGLRARRTLHIDTPLREDLVDRPPLVDRGDIVKIILESGALVVSTMGEVKEKGARGERVSVINLDSQRRVLARVIDSKTVKVDF